MIAIKEACSKLGMWRLIDCSLFVTWNHARCVQGQLLILE